MIALLGFVIIIVLLTHLQPLIRQRLWKELIIFIVLLSLGTIYSIGQIYHWPLPNPTKKMEYLFAPLYEKLE